MRESLLNSLIPQFSETSSPPCLLCSRFLLCSKTPRALDSWCGSSTSKDPGPVHCYNSGNNLPGATLHGASLLDSRILGSCVVGNAPHHVRVLLEPLEKTAVIEETAALEQQAAKRRKALRLMNLPSQLAPWYFRSIFPDNSCSHNSFH